MAKKKKEEKVEEKVVPPAPSEKKPVIVHGSDIVKPKTKRVKVSYEELQDLQAKKRLYGYDPKTEEAIIEGGGE